MQVDELGRPTQFVLLVKVYVPSYNGVQLTFFIVDGKKIPLSAGVDPTS
jgi:hypothetical protein